MRIDGRPVLVTGGAGFIGSNLVDALIERDCAVRVVDDLSVGRRENVHPAAELVVADVCDLDAMRRAVDGVDVVLHLACSNLRVSLHDPWPSHQVNGGGTLTLLEAAKEARPARFVYCSSSEVYGTAVTAPMTEEHPTEPTTVYGASKLAGEWYTRSYVETAGLSACVARPFNTYGPREHHEGHSGEVIPKMTLRALNGQPPIILGDGAQTRDFTYVTDTVAGLIAVAEAEDFVGEAVNIGAGREVSIARIAEFVAEACGNRVKPLHALARPADVRRHLADVTKARQRLGWAPTVPIEEGLPRYVAWLRATHGDELQALFAADRERNWEPAPTT